MRRVNALHASICTVSHRDLSFCGFGCLQGSWDCFSSATKGQLKFWGCQKLYMNLSASLTSVWSKGHLCFVLS